MTRRTYKTELKQMNAEQLEGWIDRKLDLLISLTMLGSADGGSTPLGTKISYAQRLLKKKTS